jgi:Tol biopolymer transport system component
VLLSSAAPIGLPSLTPSGEGIVYATLSRPRDIGFADGATDTVALILRRGFSETAPLLSPDGRWLAYVSDVTGEQEVFVRPFPNVEDSRVQISVGGGNEPVWSRDGRELFYKSGSMLLAAAVEADSVLVVTSRTELFAWGGDYIARREARSYDVSLDGGRFLMARNAEAPGLQAAAETPKATLVLVQNWLTELTRMLVEGD